MYAAGTSHPHKLPSISFLHRVAAGRIEACISTEVLQEILHRYRYIDRWPDGKNVFMLARKIVPIIAPITFEIMKQTYRLMNKHTSLFARDCLHAAACLNRGINCICTYDTDFEEFEGLSRIEPE